MRARTLTFLVVLVTWAPALIGLPAGAVSADPADVGEWSAPTDVGAVGIHAVLLPTGKFLLFSYPTSHTGTEAHEIDPVTGAVSDVSVQYERDLFCSGHSQLPDGRLLLAGGQIYGDPIIRGTREASLFNPGTRTWREIQPMARGRWYPTNVAMPDGTTLVLTGLDEDGVTVTETMESYDPVTGQWTTLPPSANNYSDLYAQMSLLPNGKVFRSEPNQDGRLFDPATNTWSFVDNMNYGWRSYAGSVLLPGLARVLASGGIGASVTNTAEVIDLSAPSPQWEYTGSMNIARWMHNLVLLPDATVLAVGGGQGPDLYDNPVKQAELYDPVTGQWSLMATQAVQRTYHGTALLLPDGRVVSAGSDFGSQSTMIEYYSPPYLFQGPRPTISSAPSAIRFGQRFAIGTPDAADITRVALIRLGSTTHTNDFDQRYLDLRFSPGTGRVNARAPGRPSLAPPGYYMLFVLNGSGVPAVARIVHLG